MFDHHQHNNQHIDLDKVLFLHNTKENEGLVDYAIFEKVAISIFCCAHHHITWCDNSGFGFIAGLRLLVLEICGDIDAALVVL